MNATANVPGSFVYSPPAGTVLPAGSAQTLSVVFTPQDAINYTAATNTVTVSVLQAPLTVKADNQSKAFGAGLPTLTASYDGFVNGDTSVRLTTLPSLSTSATALSPVGSYPIIAAGAVDPNYAISYAAGVLRVAQGAPLVTWNNPASMIRGKGLRARELNGIVNVPGTFIYNPPYVESGTNTGLPTNITQSFISGIPPVLSVVLSNGNVDLNISATVGATVTIMSTTNDLSMNAWSPVTNVTVSNITASSPGQQVETKQGLLNVTFVPGTMTLALGPANASQYQYFRVLLPYDYAILADQVLLSKTNYTPRLILVNMPGTVADVCYVNDTASFIRFVDTNGALQLISSGSTIRQIAGTLASSLNSKWTSASEFTCSNGLVQILATVVATDPPSSDSAASPESAGPPFFTDL